ncbi:MAG: hypothetical protein HRU50_12490 [Winogradskyella sp.]|uniref:hypothetical protein n=1 Tax=Winogradskyella sp. TaxID=1883156 RepID=UPI0025F30186|nr:hypothetical protein [Winogradskyella sp.]NRB60742.1 hypothetical protein [Winogradskyella sp.]
MVTILTSTSNKSQVEEIIKSIERLHELVNINSFLDNTPEILYDIKVSENMLYTKADWLDAEPPYVFPEVEFCSDNLLALVFFKLNNHLKALEYTSKDGLLAFHIMISSSIKQGFEIDLNMAQEFLSPHNECIVRHYGNCTTSTSFDALKNLYLSALINYKDVDSKAFTIKHYCNLLFEVGNYAEAEEFIRSTLYENHLTHISSICLKNSLATAMMSQLQYPFNEEKIDTILDLYDECLSFYESINDSINTGLCYVNASEVASYKNDYVSSKNYINKAILIFKKEEIFELLGEANLRKANLLYNWSKNGSPQYYKPAINAYQDTLKIFKRDTHPEQFADIHHNLALIYSEIPVSLEEKPMWTAFCASSFKEVLAIYKKETHPYQFAMASHNYATALMGFPEAKLHNNTDKAYGLFGDALSIRTAINYPFERALTLVNQLELMWLMHNETEIEETENYELMLQKANEIKTLVTDEKLVATANEHIEALENLKSVLTKNARDIDSK